MKKYVTFLLFILSLSLYSQTRKIGTDTLELAKPALKVFADTSFQANLKANYCVELDASASVDPMVPDLQYNWTIDRVHKKKGLKVDHCFTEFGNHLVALSIYDPKINQMVLNDTVFNISVPSALRFKKGGFYKILNTVTFSASDYTVSDGAFLLWNFGDGNYSSGTLVRNVYYDEGIYDVKLYELEYTSDSTVRVIQAVKDIVRIETNR